MYINKCSKCGAEFETKNPKRVICPACLYPDRNPLLNNQENKDSNQEKQQNQNPQEEPQQKDFNQEETSQQGEHRPGYNRDGGGYNRPQGSYNRDGGNYNRPQGGYNRDGGGYNRPQGGYNRDGGGYNRPQGDRPQGGYNRDSGGYNRPQGDRPQGGYNREGGGGYNRPQGGYNREGGGYNRPQGDRPQGGFNRDGGGYNRPQGGFNREGGGYNRPQGGFNRGGGPRPGGFNRGGRPQGGRRPAQRALLVSREQVAMIEVLYKRMLPLPNPDAHEIIGAEIGLEPNKVFFGINLVRQKLHLPKLPFPKRKLAITPEQLMAIKSLYEPLLPLPPIGCHKIIAGQLKMDEWRVHVGIGLVRKQLGLDRWNQERDDVPPELIKKAETEAKEEVKSEEKPAKEKKETKKK